LLATRWFEHPYPLRLGDVSDETWDAHIRSHRQRLTTAIAEEAPAFLLAAPDSPLAVGRPKRRRKGRTKVTAGNATADWLLGRLDQERIPLSQVVRAVGLPEERVFRELTGRDVLTPFVRRATYRLVEFIWLEWEVVWSPIISLERDEVDLVLNLGKWCPEVDGPLGEIDADDWDQWLEDCIQEYTGDIKMMRKLQDPRLDDPECDVLMWFPSVLESAGAGCPECDRFLQHKLPDTSAADDQGVMI
jgi:hypothetical protein